jgi:ABC-type multidrug transport system fused ATPase/permease subunit
LQGRLATAEFKKDSHVMAEVFKTSEGAPRSVVAFTRLQLFLGVFALCLTVGASVTKGATSLLDARYDRKISQRVSETVEAETAHLATKLELQALRDTEEERRRAEQERWNELQLRLGRIEGSLDRLTGHLLARGKGGG